jgi:hypothetical protein
MTHYTAESSAIALDAATNLTVMQLLSNTRPIKVTEWSVSFDGATPADEPVLVQMMRQTTTASTGAAVTPRKRIDYVSTAVTTVRTAPTSEPTSGDVLESYYLTPNGGLIVYQYPEGGEIIVPAGGRLGIVCNAPTNAVNASVWMGWEEI